MKDSNVTLMNTAASFKSHFFNITLAAALTTGMFFWAFHHASVYADSAAPDAKTLYSRYCSLCHGDQCQGAMGTPLQNMTIDDKAAIEVTQKGDGKQMPAFGQ